MNQATMSSLNACLLATDVTISQFLYFLSVDKYRDISIAAGLYSAGLHIVVMLYISTDISCFHSQAGETEESWCLTECSCYSDYSV